MNREEIQKYTFEGLCTDPSSETSLAYLVALVDSPEHPVSDPHFATYQVLYSMYDVEEQETVRTPDDLLRAQKSFLPKGYFPQTPVMVTQQWSPISAMLEFGFLPVVLNRQFNSAVAVATGIWKPSTVSESKPIEY